MEHPHEPIDAINRWQEWYKANRIVQLEKTNSTMIDLKTPTVQELWRQRVVDNFADTIVDAMGEMSGADIYKCVLQAAQENLNHCEKEYKNAKQLVDYLTNKQ